jgi:DNA-binding response OmpR family regulator/ribonuclease BN (tRNA processing enzyme)
MRNKKILIVDDNIDFLEPIENYFTKIGWDVITINSGNAMSELINGTYLDENFKIIRLSDFHCLILDHALPGADGDAILENILSEKHELPPTIILSGYLNDSDVGHYFQLGVKICCQKPISPKVLSNLAKKLITGDLGKENYKKIAPEYGIAIKESNTIHTLKPFQKVPTYETISKAVKERESFLTDNFKQSVLSATSTRYKKIQNPVFVVARRWNSWYPSYFNVPGGSYVIIMPEFNGKNDVIIIDPGFKSLKVLSDLLKISIADISTCIISHNHPDHLGGIFEYLACRNTLNEKSHLFCNPTTLEMFISHRSVEQIDEISINLLEDWDKTKFKKILLSGFRTSHNEIGPRNNPRAIEIEFVQPNGHKYKLVILGDTEYRKEFVDRLADQNVKILVLHIGSAQLNEGTGKHLYIEGTRKLLLGLNAALENIGVPEKHLLVLISEWGLEHASYDQLKEIGIQNIPDDFKGSPINDIIRCLGNDLKYINILPADIGLMVDIIDQNIYAVDEDGNKYHYEDIHYNISKDGIKYTKNIFRSKRKS